jgi:hypothetical protein
MERDSSFQRPKRVIRFSDVRAASGLPQITDIAGDDCGVSDLSDTDSFSANFRAAY